MEEITSSLRSKTISEAEDDKNTKTESAAAAEEEEHADQISRLPDEILGDILSSFSTRKAVRTSILSKRWRYVWTFAPSIKIRDTKGKYSAWGRMENLQVRKFFNFMERVLLLNNVSCLQTLIFDCFFDYKNSSRFSKLVSSLSMREAEEVSISLTDDHNVEFPPGCFTHKKLVDLYLGRGIVLKAPKSVHFPSLKILHLRIKHFFADDSMKNLLAGCPVLEELNIDRSRNENGTSINTLYIESSSLKYLQIRISEDCELLLLVIDTPNLNFLHLRDYATNNYKVMSSMSSLGDVHLDLCKGRFPSVLPNGSMLVELLGKMSSTEYLCLTGDSFTHFTFAPLHNLPVFHNLTTLEMTFPRIIGAEVWPYLLDRAPNLKKFLILKAFSHRKRKVANVYRDCQCEWHPPCYVPEGLSSHLEILKFVRFEPCAAEMEMVGYLLKNARVLKKMEMVFYGKPEKFSKLCEDLYMLPKGSAACQIQVRVVN